MSQRFPTILDDLFPDSSPEFAAIADAWPADVVIAMLALIWDGFDRVRALPNYASLDFSKDYAQLERSLTQLHAVQVAILYSERGSGFESFVPHHEPWEFVGLSARSARPPSSDIGFVLRANPRISWSMEAKVIGRPADLDKYIGDLEKLLEGTVSPFANEAALGAYLVHGNADDFFLSLAAKLSVPLVVHAAFVGRPHRYSEHERNTPSLPSVTPVHFICHHLAFPLS